MSELTLPYSQRYTLHYGGGSGYKVSGSRLNRVVLNDGREFDIGNSSCHKELKALGIDIESAFKKDRWGGEEAWRIITVNDARWLPLEIYWSEEDIYSASGYGTSGSNDGYVTRLSVKPDGTLEVTTKERRR